jgi:N-acetylmuramic acid 6-phosphate etherase
MELRMTAAETRKTETASARYLTLHAWSPNEVLESLLESQLAAVAAVRSALPAIAGAVEAAIPQLRNGGRLVYAGAGTSGRIAVQDGAELTPTFGWPAERIVLLIAGGEAALTRAIENAEDDQDRALRDLAEARVDANDVVVGIAASGTTPYTLACLREAARRNAVTVAVANNPDTPLLKAATYPILVETGSEPVAGSTRLKAGTAQKIVLNLFSTLLMIRLGRVWRGQMVDMKVTNEKLRRRAERMLESLTGKDNSAVKNALEAAGGSLKTAVVILSGRAVDESAALLAKHDGFLDQVLAEIGAVSG